MNPVESIHFKGTNQPLLRDGVETFRASTVITKPYMMADKNKFISARETPTATKKNDDGTSTHNFDRVVPSHWMNTSRSFAVLVGKSLALIGTRE